MKETWRDIPEYEGLYQVSDMGRVRSLDRIIVDTNKNRTRKFKGKVLRQGKNTSGYMLVVLSKDGYTSTKEVHKLVAITFLNHKPCGYKEVVDHIDNDKTNNSLSNLQLISHRENNSKDRFGSSKYTGVYWSSNRSKWRAAIYVDRKNKYLGSYDKEYDAHLAYQNELAKISA